MRANCDREIWRGVCGSRLTGVSSCSWRTGAAGETIRSTRGLRADWSLRAESGTDGSLTGGFDVNSASAAWRALVICSRSSPRGCGCCCRLSKICSERLIHSRLSKGRFGKFGKLDLGSRGAIRKLVPMPQPCANTRLADNGMLCKIDPYPGHSVNRGQGTTCRNMGGRARRI
jgi:hypothetical protein